MYMLVQEEISFARRISVETWYRISNHYVHLQYGFNIKQ